MPWKRGKYYVNNRRIGRRVVTTYYGLGDLALMAAQLDQAEQRQRALERDLRRAEIAEIEQATAMPEAMREYGALLDDLVCRVLTAAGYHQHKRGEWRKRRMNTLAPAPSKAEFGALFERVKRGGTEADADALRRMVADHPAYGRALDLSERAIDAMITHMPAERAGKAIARGRIDALRAELGGQQPTAIERLLVEAVAQAYLHYWMCEYQATDLWGKNMATIEFWDRRLTQCQKRYLRALEELARVRRLLKLPAIQVNIAQPGSQQLNLISDGVQNV